MKQYVILLTDSTITVLLSSIGINEAGCLLLWNTNDVVASISPGNWIAFCEASSSNCQVILDAF